MRLCSNANETYAALNTDITEIISVDNKKNQIIGLIGNSIDRILEIPEKRKCSLIGNIVEGEKLDNGTWTGNLGLLQTHKADLYLRFSAPLLHEQWLVNSQVMLTERIIVFEELNVDSEHEFYDLISNLYVGFELTFWFILTSTLFFIFKFFLFKFVKKSKKYSLIKLIRNFFINVEYNNLENVSSLFRLTSLFNQMFLMFCTLIVTNTIKTNKVVVVSLTILLIFEHLIESNLIFKDTSDIIKTEEEIFKTKRTACFLKDETEQKIAELYKGSILNKVLIEKTKLNIPLIDSEGNVLTRCIMKMGLENMRIIDLGDKYSLIRANTGYVTSAIFSQFKGKNVAWFIGGKPIYEVNQIFYYTKFRLTEKFMDTAMSQLIEPGFIVKMYEEMNYNAKNSFNRKHPLYEYLDDYISEYSGFDNLSYENYENIFKYHIIICLIILILFLIIKYSKIYLDFKMFKKINFKF